MARDITVNINDELEPILLRRVTEVNAGLVNGTTITVNQYVRDIVREDLRQHRRRYEEQDRINNDPIRQRMTPEDRAIFDALRDKYRL